MNIYETPRLVHEYLLFHYGQPDEILPWPQGPREALGFAERTVTELADWTKMPANGRALDLGCAVGRSAFELAKHSAAVIGIDYSQSFIAAATALRQAGELAYERVDEGAATSALVAHVPQDCPRERVTFEQGDAMHLRDDLGSFDLVHAANLLCRLNEPQRLLERLPDLVQPGGQLLLTTPCTWLEEFTPRGNWPTGATREWLQSRLSPHFDLALEIDLPFLIREHARKFQWSVAWGTRWLRKNRSVSEES
ncbi:MAG: putative 4-mercaptohistidine N1-methyltransferase [Prosthecobacter sp.]|nr:putative 4-mercaptohistidine N1-methyltransferase [Prosthecobacter sp.]